MSDKFILNSQGNPIPEPDLMKWGQWIETANLHVAKETVGDAEVSTVFLGLNHNYSDGTPILWETMVFGGKLDQHQERCCGNREQAEAMHVKVVKMVTDSQFR